MESTLERISRWYAAQCDGEWEHGSGVQIESLDNPGWLIKIDLSGTDLQGRPFEPISEGLEQREDSTLSSSNNWHRISVKGDVFEAAGDPSKLEFMLKTFVNWVERTER